MLKVSSTGVPVNESIADERFVREDLFNLRKVVPSHEETLSFLGPYSPTKSSAFTDRHALRAYSPVPIFAV